VEVIPLAVTPDVDDSDCADVSVDGTIAGRPYRFILDTGARRSQVVADAFILSLPAEGAEKSRGALGNSRNELVRLPALAVGPLHAEDLLASLVAADQPGARNLIGMDVLRTAICEFRFSTSELVIHAEPEEGDWSPLWLDDVAHPYVDVSWGEVGASAVWDSGAGVTVVDQAFYHRHPDLFTPGGTSLGTDATGAEVATDMAMIAGAVIGGAAFHPHKVAIVDLSAANDGLARPMELILGYPALRQADWCFDFPRQRWRFIREPAPAAG
jgi:hypothetical protein